MTNEGHDFNHHIYALKPIINTNYCFNINQVVNTLSEYLNSKTTIPLYNNERTTCGINVLDDIVEYFRAISEGKLEIDRNLLLKYEFTKNINIMSDIITASKFTYIIHIYMLYCSPKGRYAILYLGEWGELKIMNWYALFVETGKEDLVQTMIRKYFDESTIHAIVPKRKLHERKLGQTYEVCKTMFPGYVLINTQMNSNIYYKLKQIPRYYRLLQKNNQRDKNMDSYETYLFSKIDDSEMDSILQLIDHDGTIDYSTLYMENGKVIVRNGPLKGMEGVIKKIDKRKNRARIALNFMGNEIGLDLGIEMLAILE